MAATQLSISPKYLNVNEIFGPTIQGEAIHTGQHVGFLRLAGCNLSCSWCDTPYSWDWSRYDKAEESRKMTLDEVAEQIKAMKVKRLIVTGGEPMLQQIRFAQLQELTGCKLDIETNGTIAPKDGVEQAVDLFCVSPKLAHANDPEAARIKAEPLIRFAELAAEGKALFKFVAKDISDFDEIDAICNLAYIPTESVWIMPEGADTVTQLNTARKLADAVIKRGWNLSLRVHTLIWNQERAR
jgi:7-carboxy-7-deazaguanine synthase